MGLPDSAPIVASIIIPCYRRGEMAVSAVRSALEQSFDPVRYEVIAVDSSPDLSVVEALEKLAPEARCGFRVFHKSAEGPGPSRNFGAARSNGKYLAFLDSDCVADKDWLNGLVAGMGDRIGIVQGQTLPMPWKRQGIFSHTLRIERESFLYETANIAYPREAFEQTGGFLADRNPHADTPLGGEDVDLAWRIRRSGWKTRFAPDAIVYHEVLPIRWKEWIWISRLRVFPSLLAKVPELREFFFLRYFYDRAQAFLTLAIVGAGLGWIWPQSFLLVLPYVLYRASEPTRSLKGILRLARPAVYLMRDLASFAILLIASIRAGRLLL